VPRTRRRCDLATHPHRPRHQHHPGHLTDPLPARARLSEFIHFRDKTCRRPGCNRTRVETDHTIRREHGGPTTAANLGDFCTHHHQLKDAPGWTVAQDGTGVFTFRTPHGRIYRTRPPGADGDVRPIEIIDTPKPAPPPEARPPDDNTPPF
jgi:hypothetical protein